MVGTWIINSVSPKIQASIIYKDTTLEIWTVKGMDLRLEIVELHQGEQSIIDYFTQLKVLWDQLQNLTPFPFALMESVFAILTRG